VNAGAAPDAPLLTPLGSTGRKSRGISPDARAHHARHFSIALALAAVALPGALPDSRGSPDPVALLTWLALVAPAVGAAAGGARLPSWPHAAAIPGSWMLLLVAVDLLAPRDLDTPVWAALATSGLFASGFALGRALRREHRLAAATAVLGFAAALVFAPVAGGFLRAPWPASATAVLLDISPATLLAECASVDWLRHPSIYDAAGSTEIDPRSRSPYRPPLAAGIVLVLGCALALCAERFARAREQNSDLARP